MKIYNAKITSNPNIFMYGIKNAVSALTKFDFISDQEINRHINTHLGILSSVGPYSYKSKIVCRIQNIYFIDVIVSPKKDFNEFSLMTILGLNDISSNISNNRPYKIYRFRIPISKDKSGIHHFKK